jgi:hypothetical protein
VAARQVSGQQQDARRVSGQQQAALGWLFGRSISGSGLAFAWIAHPVPIQEVDLAILARGDLGAMLNETRQSGSTDDLARPREAKAACCWLNNNKPPHDC